MLIDFILRSADQAPEALIESLLSAGINGVVYDVNDTALSEAVISSDLTGYQASVFIDDGAALFALSESPAVMSGNDLETWSSQAKAAGAIVVASHPYDRSQGRPWGDRVYRIAGLTHVVATSTERSRDQLALTVAKKRNLGTIAASISNAEARGLAATVLKTEGQERADLIQALATNSTVCIRMESASSPYVEPIEPSPQRASRPRDGGRGNDRRDRGRNQRRDSGRR